MNGDIVFLTDFLKKRGFIVHPTEISCGRAKTPQTPYYLVDAAAFRKGRFYAFEYKSSNDSISSERAIKQIENYKNSFDYVILLVEIPRKGRVGLALGFKNGRRIYDILEFGAGIWVLSINRVSRKYMIREIIKPKRQHPHILNRKFIEEQFQINLGFNPYQQTLDSSI